MQGVYRAVAWQCVDMSQYIELRLSHRKTGLGSVITGNFPVEVAAPKTALYTISGSENSVMVPFAGLPTIYSVLPTPHI
jgi:hypothetical protein